MRNLPPAIIGVYTNRASAKKVGVGFDSLQKFQGASAPTSLGAFFTPEGFPFGGVRWEAFGLAGFLERRSVNPSYAATTIFDRVGCRLVIHQFKDILIMPILIVQDGATLPELASQAHATSIHCRHLSALINDLVEDQDDFQNPQHFQRAAALCGLLASVLDQQKLVCEELEYAAQEVGV